MFSKRLIILLFSAITLATVPACSLYEGPPPKKKKEFQKNSLNCLKDFRAKLIDYADGRSTAEDVNRLANCSIEALRTFGDLTRGQDRDRFTAEEIRTFLQRYFLEDVTISDGFMKEFMRAKQAFLGGKSSDFSREDLKTCEALIVAIRDILLRLQPSMPISFERMQRETPAYVEETGKALIDSAELFGKRITENQSTYSFEDMGRLFDEIGQTFDSTKSVLASVRKHLKLAGVLKEVVIDPYRPREIVTARDWRIIISEGARWTATYLQLLNMDSQYSTWMRGDGRTHLGIVLNEALSHIDRAVKRHCPEEAQERSGCKVIPGIPIQSLQMLMETVEWDGSLLGAKFQKATIVKLLETVIKRTLGGAALDESGRKTNRLTMAHVDRLRSLIREWLDGSRYVEGAYATILRSESFHESALVTTADLTALDPKEVLRNYGGVTPEALAVAESLRALFKKTSAIQDGNSRGAIFDGKNATRERVYKEMDRYTWLRPVFKRFVLGYIEGPDMKKRIQNYEHDGLAIGEFTALITDFWQLLGDVKFVGPKNTPSGDAKKRFRESSLFMQISDGNNVISMDEGLQLVLYMFSANPLAIDTHDRAEKLCQTGVLDDYGEPRVETKCYRAKVYDFSAGNRATADLWKPFPLLIQFYDGLSITQKADFQEYVERASRKPEVPQGAWFGSDDSQTTVMMFHYIEALFQRFDSNKDGFLDEAEAEIAFPIFRNTLAAIPETKLSEAKLKSVFFWLLEYGAPPVDESMGGWSKFWNGVEFMMYHWGSPKFNADRLSVLKVFATLATQAAPAAQSSAKN